MLMVLCPMIVGKCVSSGSVRCVNNLICASNFIFFHLGWQQSQVLQGRGGSAVADLKGVPWNTPFHGLPLRILSMSSLQHNNLICTSDTYISFPAAISYRTLSDTHYRIILDNDSYTRN